MDGINMSKYALGIDYGTLSGRALLIDVKTGEETATSEFYYPHAVMDSVLPDGTKLGLGWALQHPQDYLAVLENVVSNVIKKASVSAYDIIGIGIDFTACTVLPVTKEGTPLCFLPGFKDNPHAYVKLWKHHAAQDKANIINETAERMGESWLKRYGGKISSEWLFPKLLEILEEAPEVYDNMGYFIEAADWIIWQLTGIHKRNTCTAGYKAMWHKIDGYPSDDFFATLNPRLRHVVRERLNCTISPIGTIAGKVTEEMAAFTGLIPGTPVAVGNVDAHVCVPAVKIDEPGKMLAIIGTSTCHMLLSNEEKSIPGVCGCVEDGIIPGFFGYEAGQSCVGDHFAWLVNNCVPHAYQDEADKQNKNIHAFLQEKLNHLKPGECGLLALDWWNGNRSVLMDADLSGLIIGITLQTKPEEIYRALIEATAFGTRKIIETFENNGVPVNEFYAAGGIAEKSPIIMQIYADILKKPIFISGSSQGPTLGAAIFGAVAGGAYPDVKTAARILGKVKEVCFIPNTENSFVYDRLYSEYEILHDYFGKGLNNIMKNLKMYAKQTV
jgi:L-ribulokinase